jgi:hypothetical protein
MIPRALALVVGLAALALLAGCGDDEGTTTVTVRRPRPRVKRLPRGRQSPSFSK